MRSGNPDSSEYFDLGLHEIERLSNCVLDLVQAGCLDEAESGCRVLKQKYPDQHDWIDCTGALHASRGELDLAIECYKQCLVFIDDHPDGFDEDSRDRYRGLIHRLESKQRCG